DDVDLHVLHLYWLEFINTGLDGHSMHDATTRQAAPRTRICHEDAWALPKSSSRLLGKCLLHPRLHLFRRQIFDMRRKGPLMAAWINHDAIPVAPEHVGRRHFHGRAGLLSPLDGVIAVLDVVMDSYRRAFEGLGRTGLAAAKLREIVNQKQVALADAQRR